MLHAWVFYEFIVYLISLFKNFNKLNFYILYVVDAIIWLKNGTSLSTFDACQGRQSRRDPRILGRGWWGVAGGVVGVGSWNIIIFYEVQEVCSKVGTFEEK